MTILEFLDARISEDEADVQGWPALYSPRARVLAECNAKRHILDEALVWGQGCLNVMTWYLAEPYSDHPDYREEWRP